ncbi:MAG: hypothetical protein COB92_00595 [Robiginitomaculum sp.]|nr:MAG: hypothetical protein COB92_00595 [Robiginitomaculum sp.]
MDGFDDLTVDTALLDSSTPDAIGVLSFNSTSDFNAVMSLFSGVESGNLSFDDFSNDTFRDVNNSFNGFDNFVNDFFGWDGDDEPPTPDPDPEDEPPIDEVVVTATRSDPWVTTVYSINTTPEINLGLFDGMFTQFGDGGGGGVINEDTSESTPKKLADENDIDIKEGADISDLTDDMTDTFDDISEAWADEAPGVTPVITSGGDGTHSTNSLHYDGNAVDLRTNNLTQAQTTTVASALSTSLGSDYDVVVESDHIHVEYDPG